MNVRLDESGFRHLDLGLKEDEKAMIDLVALLDSLSENYTEVNSIASKISTSVLLASGVNAEKEQAQRFLGQLKSIKESQQVAVEKILAEIASIAEKLGISQERFQELRLSAEDK